MSDHNSTAWTSGQSGLEIDKSSHGLQVAQPEKEVVQPGKESLQSDPCQWEKEVAYPQFTPNAAPEATTPPTHERQSQTRICGIRRRVFWASVVAATVVAAVTLGVGLGVSLNSSSEPSKAPAALVASANGSQTAQTPATATSSSALPATQTLEPRPTATHSSARLVDKQLSIGGSLDNSYYSNEGVWNGTGLSHNWQSFLSNYGDAPSEGQSLVMYYQHHSGAVRWMRLTIDGDWVRGSSDSEIVASNPKNSTPISAVTYIDESRVTEYRHVFYIDKDYRVRQRSGSNTTTAWTDGTIDGMTLTTYRGDLIGLQACPAPPNALLRLWYASSNTTFEEYIFRSDTWIWQRSWTNYSGAAGVGCYSWGADNYTYATFINLDHKLELWYKEKTDIDPQGWRQTAVSIPDVHPASSVSLSNHFLVIQQAKTSRLQLSKMTWNGSNTSLEYSTSYSLEDVADSVNGTHLTALARFEGGVDTMFVYTQLNGDDITEFSRPIDGVEIDGTVATSWRRNDRAIRG